MTATITGSKKKGIVDVKAVLENIRANPRILFFCRGCGRYFYCYCADVLGERTRLPRAL